MSKVHVDWSYPSSPNAERAGFGKTGCWSVKLYCDTRPPQAIAAYAPDLKPEAIRYAASLGHPWKFPASENLKLP